MYRRPIIVVAVASLIAGASIGTASAAGALSARAAAVNADAGTRARAVAAGRQRAVLCAGCHGSEGISRREWIPNLAGQNLDYLLDQTKAYADGTRKYGVMNSLAERFSDEDIVNLSVFYHNLAPEEFQPPIDTALAERGERIYQTSCFLCHGKNGRGKQGYSWVARQKPEYVRRALTRYRDAKQGRINADMATYTSNLDDVDINALAIYLTTLN